jgi:CRP-like cAMP-binding protein
VPPNPKLLDAIPLFASMDDDERTALAAIMDEVGFKAGQIIYRAADVGGTLYVLISGEVEMSIEDDDGKKVRPPDIGSSRGERFLALDGQADT